jgi:hypothetical protein
VRAEHIVGLRTGMASARSTTCRSDTAADDRDHGAVGSGKTLMTMLGLLTPDQRQLRLEVGCRRAQPPGRARRATPRSASCSRTSTCCRGSAPRMSSCRWCTRAPAATQAPRLEAVGLGGQVQQPPERAVGGRSSRRGARVGRHPSISGRRADRRARPHRRGDWRTVPHAEPRAGLDDRSSRTTQRLAGRWTA